MKIGIITQPLSSNYGGILQNYALQQTLVRLGHQPYTFDLGRFNWLDWSIVVVKVTIKKLLLYKCNFPITPIRQQKKEAPLRRFVYKYISLAKPRVTRLSSSLVRKNRIDALVVGSDQVWRPMYNYKIEDMYLSFAECLNMRKVAYAASFGTEQWEYSLPQQQRCAQLAKKFDAISVREESGVQLCKDYLGVEAKHVLDPTMLLCADDYNKLLEGIAPIEQEKYLFVYMLDITEEKLKYVESVADKLKLKLLVKSAGAKVSDSDSIEQFLLEFRDAEYVITDSFHGTVFSILYNKDFVVLGNEKRGQARFGSLLRLLGLESRLINNLSKIESVGDIDWLNVNNKLNILRRDSLEYLRQSLE